MRSIDKVALLISVLTLSLGCRDQPGLADVDTSFDANQTGTTVEIAADSRFEIVLGSPVGVAPEHRYRWAAEPTITGSGIVFEGVDERSPGSDVDGGSSGYRYRFRASDSGEATITIAIAERGEKAPSEPFRLSVEVRRLDR